MKKINLPNILDIYWADGERGEVLRKKGSKYQVMTGYYEEGRKEPRISLKQVYSKPKKYPKGLLVLGAYEGFKDRKLFVYRFKSGDAADTRRENLEWVERFGFLEALTPEEYRMFKEKIDRISMDACIAFSRYVDYRIKTDNPLDYSEESRKRFFKRIMSINIQNIKNISDAVDLSFLNLTKSGSKENK